MHRRRSYRILAFALSALLLFSSFGWTLDAHFCRGQFKGIALFGKLNCHADAPENRTASCCAKPERPIRTCCSVLAKEADGCGQMVLQEPDCCSDELQFAKADLLLPGTTDKVAIPLIFSTELFSFQPAFRSVELQSASAPRPPPPPEGRLYKRFENYRL